jgi:hypothetical protein
MRSNMEAQLTDAKPVPKKKRKEKVRRPNGRPMLYPDKTIVRMVGGSIARIDEALHEGERQGDFMRVAVERELKARWASSSNSRNRRGSFQKARNAGEDAAKRAAK